MGKNKFLQWTLFFVFSLTASTMHAQHSSNKANTLNEHQQSMADIMIRISEIEIFPEYMEEYKAILAQESSESVKIEPEVIAIYPMYQKNNPGQIRIVEIYANQAAYKSHLQTPHFLHYKTTTLKMVKTLKLIDMEAIDPETMNLVFKKLSN